MVTLTPIPKLQFLKGCERWDFTEDRYKLLRQKAEAESRANTGWAQNCGGSHTVKWEQDPGQGCKHCPHPTLATDLLKYKSVWHTTSGSRGGINDHGLIPQLNTYLCSLLTVCIHSLPLMTYSTKKKGNAGWDWALPELNEMALNQALLEFRVKELKQWAVLGSGKESHREDVN